MKVEFDKRLELIYGLLYCVNKDMNNKLHPELFEEVLSTYCKEFYELYKENASQELIDYIKAYGINGNYVQPSFIALSLDNDYNIVENEQFTKYVIMQNSVFNKEKTERLLKEFVSNSNYEDFYNNHKSLYDSIIKSFKESMKNCRAFDENFLINFYGYKIDGVKDIIIKLYNFTTGSCGIIVGDYQYYIQRVDNINEDEKDFVFKPKYLNIIHELSHPYIAPYIEKYFKEIDFYKLLDEAKENGLPACYHNASDDRPYAIFNEYLVRTIAIYLGSENKEDKQKQINKEIKNGFIYIGDLVNLFDKKEDYDDFNAFFEEEIVKYCLTLSDDNL